MNKIEPIAVLRRAQEIIAVRGWSTAYSIDDQGPLNIRSAVSKACRALVPDDTEFHRVYVQVVAIIARHIGGIQNWELTKAGRTTAEVTQMLTEAINREETSAQARANRVGKRRGSFDIV